MSREAFEITWSIIFGLNVGITVFSMLIYVQHIFYTAIGVFNNKKYAPAKNNHRYAVLISARNESKVIAHLIASLKKQNYPGELISVFVVADNCTDNTAEVARQAGAIVYERFNEKLKGKGYAIDYLMNKIFLDYGKTFYDAFMFFDADNIVHSDFVMEMNKLYDSGILIGTGYRNSKNFGDNYITMGHAVGFLRECKYSNAVRDLLGVNSYVAGTGFYAASKIFVEEGGWKYHLLTDDVEFTLNQTLKGRRIGYSKDAIFYDEQPTKMKDSFNQRTRWIKGQLQCFKRYGARLFKKAVLQLDYSSYDMLTHVMPGHLIAITWTVLYHTALLILGFAVFSFAPYVLYMELAMLVLTLLFVFIVTTVMATLVVITEYRKIKATKWQKIKAIFTFTFFMFSYIPVVYYAFFKKVQWVEIPHDRDIDVDNL